MKVLVLVHCFLSCSIRVADPHNFKADPDPPFHFNPDPAQQCRQLWRCCRRSGHPRARRRALPLPWLYGDWRRQDNPSLRSATFAGRGRGRESRLAAADHQTVTAMAKHSYLLVQFFKNHSANFLLSESGDIKNIVCILWDTVPVRNTVPTRLCNILGNQSTSRKYCLLLKIFPLKIDFKVWQGSRYPNWSWSAWIRIGLAPWIRIRIWIRIDI